MKEKVELYNDLYPDLDIKINGQFYDAEKDDTGVVYQIFNLKNGKSYIGKAYSYVKNGNQPIRRHGAKDRFYKHWIASRNENIIDCPIFYEALRNSDIHDWFIFTLKVCGKGHLKEWETKMIKMHGTSDPNFGYNYFVGDNKPDDPEYLTKYKNNKALSNAKRAVDGSLRKKDHGKKLPPNINHRISKRRDGTVCGEGYFVQIKINNKLYNKAFLSMSETMEEKLEKAKKQLELFKKEAQKQTIKKSISGSKTVRK